MAKLKYAFLGATQYSKELLLFLIEQGFVPVAVFSIPPEFDISYSDKPVKNVNYADLRDIADAHDIPFYIVDAQQGRRLKDYNEIIAGMDLDLLLVLGWYYMVPASVRELAKYGAWGIHASLLPKYAGGAPLNWAIINGEEQTGVTLFRLGEGVDDGDIIEQKSFSIDFEDTIKEVYAKATVCSKELLKGVLSRPDAVTFTPQDKSNIEVYPQRTPEDGEIDLSRPAKVLYDFIRAQSAPYPGAYIRTRDGKKLVIEKARIEES